MRVVVLGSGRGSNARALLEAERDGRLGRAEIVALLTDREDSGLRALGAEFGRAAAFIDGGPFRTKLEGAGEERFLAAVGQHQPDLIVLAGFLRVLKERFLRVHAGRVVNLHPSLLPAFPGLDAIGQALRAGVRLTGCTVHWVNSTVDGGRIIDQRAVRVEPDDSVETLAERVHAAEHELLPAVVASLSQMGPQIVEQTG